MTSGGKHLPIGMNINDPDSPACRALEYLCLLARGDCPSRTFQVTTLSSDLGLSAQEGRSVFSYLVGKGLARHIGSAHSLVPTEAGFQHMGYFLKRHHHRHPDEECRASEDGPLT